MIAFNDAYRADVDERSKVRRGGTENYDSYRVQSSERPEQPLMTEVNLATGSDGRVEVPEGAKPGDFLRW